MLKRTKLALLFLILLPVKAHSVPSSDVSSLRVGTLGGVLWGSSGVVNGDGTMTYTASTPSRSLNSDFTPSATNATFACYTISIACSISLGGSCTGTVELRSDTSSPPTTVRAITSQSLGGTLVIGLTLSNTQQVPVCHMVPPGHNVRLVSSGGATITITAQSETSIATGL